MTDNTVSTVSVNKMDAARLHAVIDLLLSAVTEQAAPGDKVLFDVRLWVHIERAVSPTPAPQETTP